MTYRAEHALALLAGLNELREDESAGSCDLRLVVGDQQLLAHKLVLIAVSDYFRAMFAHNFVERHQSEVRLNAVEFEYLKCAIDFIYTGTIEITENNVEGLLIVATHLQIGLLVQACERYLFEKVSVFNVGEVETIADRYSLSRLHENVDIFILSNIISLAANNQEYFVDISIERFRRFLDDNRLNVLPNDITLLGAIRCWVNARRDERIGFLSDLLSRLRFVDSSLLAPFVEEFGEIAESLNRLSHGYIRMHEPMQHQVAPCFMPRRSTPSLTVYFDGGDFRFLERQSFSLVDRDSFKPRERIRVELGNSRARQVISADTLDSRNCQFLMLSRSSECLCLLQGARSIHDQVVQSQGTLPSDTLPASNWLPGCSISALEFITALSPTDNVATLATDNQSRLADKTATAPSSGTSTQIQSGSVEKHCELAQYTISIIVIGGYIGYDRTVTSMSPLVSRFRFNQRLSELIVSSSDTIQLNSDEVRCTHLSAHLPVAQHAACTVTRAHSRCVFVSGGLSFVDQQRYVSPQLASWHYKLPEEGQNAPMSTEAAWNRCFKLQFSRDGERSCVLELPRLNEPRSHHAMLEYHGSLYVFGGVCRSEQSSDRFIAVEALNLDFDRDYLSDNSSTTDPTWRWTLIELTCLTNTCTLQFAVLNDSIYTISKQDADAAWNGIYRLHFEDQTKRHRWHRCKILNPQASTNERRPTSTNEMVFTFAHCFPTYASDPL